jgi:hypothetical protein
MNILELQDQLEAEGIRRNLYSLDGTPADECMVLEQRASNWVVFYSERGQQTGRMDFSTEDAACQYLLKQLRRDKQYQALQQRTPNPD